MEVSSPWFPCPPNYLIGKNPTTQTQLHVVLVKLVWNPSLLCSCFQPCARGHCSFTPSILLLNHPFGLYKAGIEILQSAEIQQPVAQALRGWDDIWSVVVLLHVRTTPGCYVVHVVRVFRYSSRWFLVLHSFSTSLKCRCSSSGRWQLSGMLNNSQEKQTLAGTEKESVLITRKNS